MNAAEDKVLEHALGELLGEGKTDLAERVLDSLRRAEQREVGAARVVAKTPRLRYWLAAAALLTVSVFLLVDRFGDGQEDYADVLLATSNEALGVLRVGESEARSSDSFRPGETLVNGPERERLVAFSSGEVIALGPCSMLTLDRDEQGLVLTPRLGSVTLQSEGHAVVRFQTRLGTLTFHAPGQLRIEMNAEGYSLEHPERFQLLAKELHMKSAIPLIVTLATLIEGTASLETAAGTRSMNVGEVVQDQEAELSTKQIESKLLEEVGTWDLTVTNFDQNGQRGDALQGVEICRAGPGGKWLISDLSVVVDSQSGREIAVHTVVGFRAGKGIYAGSLVDSFGGEVGLLKGTPEPDLGTRTLETYSAESTPGFESRWRMQWLGPDERRTEIETPQGEEWVLVRVMLHHRRE